MNFGSAGGTEGWAGQAAYAAAKEAVRGLTKAAAAEWGPYGITVNAVVPTAETDAYRAWAAGLSDDEQAAFLATVFLLRRVGDPERDIGRAVVFLVGPDASYITGRATFVDGGRGFYDRRWGSSLDEREEPRRVADEYDCSTSSSSSPC